MKKLVPLFVVMAVLLLGLSGASLQAAGPGGAKVYEHNFQTKVEPIEVQIVKYPQYLLYSNQTVEVEYKVINRSTVPWELEYYFSSTPVGYSGTIVVEVLLKGESKQNERYIGIYPGQRFVIMSQGEHRVYISVAPAAQEGVVDWNLQIIRYLPPEKG